MQLAALFVGALDDLVADGGLTLHFEGGGHLAVVVTIAALVVAGTSWRRLDDHNPKEQS